VISATSLYISDLVEKGRELEARGREIAVRRRGLISKEDDEWTAGMHFWHFELKDRVRTLRGVAVSEDEFRAISAACDTGKILSRGAARAVKAGEDVFERGTSLFKLLGYEDFKFTTSNLREYCENQRELTGRSATLLVDYMHPGEYSWSDFARDFTSCFSPLLNWLDKRLGSVVNVYRERVYASTRSLPVAVDCARDWMRALEYFNSWKLCAVADYDEACCFVRENEAVFRLGEREAGYVRAEAEFAPLSARVKLIFPEEPSVHRVFAELSEHYGCRVVEQRPEEYTVVDAPRSALVDFFRGVLALAVSMDKRLRRPDLYWGFSWYRGLSEEWKKLTEQGLDPLVIERELCVKAYEKLRELERARG
jgi:hypothetical protein